MAPEAASTGSNAAECAQIGFMMVNELLSYRRSTKFVSIVKFEATCCTLYYQITLMIRA